MTTLYEEVRAVLREGDFRLRKSRGQNFLIHENVVESILRLLDLDPSDEVLEIGPGLGFLTRRLVERVATVWAVEIDGQLVARLRQSGLAANQKFHLIHGDILEVPLADMLPSAPIKLVGNLPYSISTQVLFRILARRGNFSSLVLMVQKEVADRIAGQPGNKDYGTLSVWCQAHGRITAKLKVSPEAFFPRPKVRSTVLKIELYPEPRAPDDELALLRMLVRAAFGQRRKTLANALMPLLKFDRDQVESFLRAQNIDPRRRGETLSVGEFIKLAHGARENALLPAGH